MKLIKDVITNETEAKDFLTACLSGFPVSPAFTTTAADLTRYAYIFLNKYSNRILSEYVENKTLAEFNSVVANFINSEIKYSCGKVIAAWAKDYDAVQMQDVEELEAFGYNSPDSQLATRRTSTRQQAKPQEAIMAELELRKNSIVDLILKSIVDQITLKIY